MVVFPRHKFDVLLHLRFGDALHVPDRGFFQADEVTEAHFQVGILNFRIELTRIRLFLCGAGVGGIAEVEECRRDLKYSLIYYH